MKSMYKVMLAIALAGMGGLLFVFVTTNGYSPYYEGISLVLYSDYKIQELPKDDRSFAITKITDDDLKDLPELSQLINRALSKKYPMNQAGTVPITFEELDGFQRQYAEILAQKYSRKPESFFKSDYENMPEKFLKRDPAVHLRTFEGNYFEYEGIQYGIQPDTFYVPFMEDESLLRLEVFQTNGPLRSDNTWADLTQRQVDIKPKIIAAISDIGTHQENIEVQTSGLAPDVMTKYKNWQKGTLGSSFFEYRGKVFLIGFWIA